MTALTIDPLGRKMRPRCGQPIRNGIYWGDQVCGRPEGHSRRHLSVEAYKRYLARQREVNADWYATMGDTITQARRARYAERRDLINEARRARYAKRWAA